MGTVSEEGHEWWREAAKVGVRGVLIAASCCSPTHRGADGEDLWSLKREPWPHPRSTPVEPAPSVPSPGRVHVIGSRGRAEGA